MTHLDSFYGGHRHCGVTLVSIAGASKTALVAWLGAFLDFPTAALALLLFPPFRLHGAIQSYSETLLYSGFENLNLERLFIAAVFLGASGAVIDLSVDVSAAMNEISQKRPDLSAKELMKSGIRVGRPMATTMVTTLLMAYMSEYMALLMVLISKGIPPMQVANLNYISAEVLKTSSAVSGLITVAPFTALVGGYIYVRWRSDAWNNHLTHHFLPTSGCKIAASGCDLRIGDQVAPETRVGVGLRIR